MAAWAREVGELDWAEDELSWADMEEDPKEVPPCDIAALIKDYEWQAENGAGINGVSLKSAMNASAAEPDTGIVQQDGNTGKCDSGSTQTEDQQDNDVENSDSSSTQMAEDLKDDTEKCDSTSSTQTDDQQDDDAENCDSSSTQVENHPNISSKPRICMNTLLASMSGGSTDLPDPWPLVPFSMEKPQLQKRIPIHLLPQKLVVHDPWDLLAVKNSSETRHPPIKVTEFRKKWVDNDVVRVYRLQLSEAGKKRIEEEKQAIAKAAETSSSLAPKEGYIIAPDTDTTGPTYPTYMVLPPPRPPPPESTPEGHLYLSPAHHAGKGHHSVVYHAELELPRSLLTGEQMCKVCLVTKAYEMIAEIEKNPENQQDLSKARICTIEEVKKPQIVASFWTAKERQEEQVAGKSNTQTTTTPKEIFTVKPAESIHTNTYEGPLHRIYPNVKWQNPERGPLCSHLRRTENVPLTTRVAVIAKLSIQWDQHLVREGQNYQSFPDHFFEHWSGYNLIPPLLDPVPVGAVVPQFYGYYIPEKPQNPDDDSTIENQAHNGVDGEYLSPILLIEDCGVPVDKTKLDQTDKTTCGSLLHRFHNASWIHDSFYERNILMQPGPLTVFPTIRKFSKTNVFRLIDFGRSWQGTSYDATWQDREREHRRATELFDLL